jgi:hypothetical protein
MSGLAEDALKMQIDQTKTPNDDPDVPEMEAPESSSDSDDESVDDNPNVNAKKLLTKAILSKEEGNAKFKVSFHESTISHYLNGSIYKAYAPPAVSFAGWKARSCHSKLQEGHSIAQALE